MNEMIAGKKRIFWALLACLGVFALGNIAVAVARAEESPAPSRPSEEEELCRWQKDVAFFMALKKKEKKEKAVLSLRHPCEKTLRENSEEGEDEKKKALKEVIGAMAVGYPIEVMIPAILRYESDIAGLIVGIAKKESNWGKRVPRMHGEECFNFWGYRASGSLGLTPDGYGCFATPEEAVQVIGDRLVKLVQLRSGSEPHRMIVWKCGSSCAGHSDYSVDKWISDVALYYEKIKGK